MTEARITTLAVMGADAWSQRADVKEALRLLADPVPALDDGHDVRWPNLTDAIHWLIDDTGWDESKPGLDVGRRILRTTEEATVVSDLVAAVMIVHDRQGPTAPDAAWFSDAEWPSVQELARSAYDVFSAGDARPAT